MISSSDKYMNVDCTNDTVRNHSRVERNGCMLIRHT